MHTMDVKALGPVSPELLLQASLNATSDIAGQDGYSDEPLPEDELEADHMEFYLMLFILMLFFFVMAAINEKFKPRCGHQTSYTIIFGVLISIVLWYGFGNSRTAIYKFDQNIFFDFLLPPIILSSGFNMRRKKFF